jgi:hypothetical protein
MGCFLYLTKTVSIILNKLQRIRGERAVGVARLSYSTTILQYY